MSTWIFLMKILDNLSKHSIYFENSPVGRANLSYYLHFGQNFQNVWVNNHYIKTNLISLQHDLDSK